MNMQCKLLFSALALSLFVSTFALADEPKKAADKADVKKEAEPEKPKVVKLSGVFEAVKSAKLIVNNEHFTSLEIKRILPHGAMVSKGQNVVWFDTETIDKQLREAEIDLRLAKLKLSDDELAYKQFLQKQTLDRQAVRQKRDQAQQRFDNFVEVDRDRQVLSAQFSLKSSRASLENVQEELDQLQQMYEEDDLTEESEEIVLKRAKQAVEFAEFRLAGTEISSQRAIEQNVPRAVADQDTALARALIDYEMSMHALESSRTREDISIARKRDKFKDQEEKLQEQRAERKDIVVKSPIDGIVLHGELKMGKLGTKPSTLKQGSKIATKQIVATIASPSRLQIRVSLDEKDLWKIAVGNQCKVKPKASPEMKAIGIVKSIAKVPYAGTSYDCVIKLKVQGKAKSMLIPTMTCDLEFSAEKKNKSDIKNQANASSGETDE